MRDDEEDFDDEGDYAGFDTSGDDEDPTLPCPACGAVLYDDSVQCPRCGHYLSRADLQRSATPLWIVVGAGICIAIVILWVVMAGLV